jgi:hypothetical protein
VKHPFSLNIYSTSSKEVVLMNRLRQWSALVLLLVPAGLLLCAVRGDGPPAKEKKAGDRPAQKWFLDRAVTVSAAPAPVPALRYRLFPRLSDLKEGNAVPIYLRFAHERSDARKKELREKTEQWNQLPPDELPLDEVKKFLAGYRYNLRQLDLGARRKTADWNYTLDAGDPIGLLLPDIQEMRMQTPLLILKARVEAAEGRFADAVRTLETGFSFSRQINEAPFLISGLVGIACASQFADATLDLVERPDAPNLYWALAVLPRPMIDLRRPNEFEQALLEMQFPDLADLDRPRTPQQWDATLRHVREEVEGITKRDRGFEAVRPGSGPADPAGKSPDLPAARKYLVEVAKVPAATVEKMPPAEALLRYLVKYYHELRDEVFKANYLPFPQARPLALEADKRLKAAPDTEAARLARYFLPAVIRVQAAQARIDRKLAAQRAIEALRMHAAAHGGRLPAKLADVAIVPVPNDPGTGRPFEYQRDGATATLTSRLPGEELQTSGLRYRVTLRK